MRQLGTVVVVGVGLIGGSIGRALRDRALAENIVGVGRNVESLDEAKRLGAIDTFTTDLAEASANADLVVICTPVPLIAEAACLAARSGPPGLLVTDAGSTKRSIVEAVESVERGRLTFVGAHPIAGSERKGPGHADPNLFEGRACVLTPTSRTPMDRLERARAFWASIGCRVVDLDPDAHDEALALTSHLPHVVASALAASVPAEILGLGAGAYRDGTRVAGSDAELWAGIFRDNRLPLLRALDTFATQLDTFRQTLEADDSDALIAWWNAGRSLRRQFHEPGGSGLKS